MLLKTFIHKPIAHFAILQRRNITHKQNSTNTQHHIHFNRVTIYHCVGIKCSEFIFASQSALFIKIIIAFNN
jgi:hypothetical protein